MRIRELRSSDPVNTVLLFSISAVIGGLGWSGNPTLHFLALLYPFVYIHSRRRLDALRAARNNSVAAMLNGTVRG